ncbi:CST complex subunit [Vigna angularis]|uniref:CST complex subunit STN1 n=1 Tax=Phaseolus angularis TaxID=3914 RepID=A0A8T0JPH7_PHAAN|nr:CST complex subunit [Vigna angularis]
MENGNNNAVALQNTHVKLLAFDLLSLTQFPFRSPDAATSFLRRGIPISRVETLGTITLLHLKPDRLLRFAIDDGTGCVPCVLWLNNANSPSVVRRRRHELAARFCLVLEEEIVLACGLRIRLRISIIRGGICFVVTLAVVFSDEGVSLFRDVVVLFPYRLRFAIWVFVCRLCRGCWKEDEMMRESSYLLRAHVDTMPI